MWWSLFEKAVSVAGLLLVVVDVIVLLGFVMILVVEVLPGRPVLDPTIPHY